MNKTLRVARHEFLVTAANKAFVAITLLGPVLILAVSVLPGLAATSGSASSGAAVALVGGDEALRSGLAAALVGSKSRVEAVSDEGAAKARQNPSVGFGQMSPGGPRILLVS